jgi:hypothetical protein
MSGRITAVFGGIVLMALVGLDYGAAANGRTPDDPLGVTEHVLIRFAQLKQAVGLAPASAPAGGGLADGAVGANTAVLSGTSAPGSAEGQIGAALAAADAKAAASAQNEPDPAAAGKHKDPAPKDRPARKKPGQITVGIGTCAKRSGGKFCSVGGG